VSRWPKAKRWLISAFIAFHLLAVLCWAFPSNSLLVGGVKKLVTPYMLWAGLFQSWDMFAPNPRSLNIYVTAEITYANGQRRVWEFPRMEKLGLVDRYFKERYRKWANDNLRLDENARLWPDAARYIARLNAEPGNPPVEVRLKRSWQQIPGPTSNMAAPIWFHYAFFTYRVAPGDLS
jgi:hypothetical protein